MVVSFGESLEEGLSHVYIYIYVYIGVDNGPIRGKPPATFPSATSRAVSGTCIMG